LTRACRRPSCWLLNAGSLEDYLKTVKTWLDANPNEGACSFVFCQGQTWAGKAADKVPLLFISVVSLLWVNIDNQPVEEWAGVYVATGMDTVSTHRARDVPSSMSVWAEQISYAPPNTSMTANDWPTLQEMIVTGKRSVLLTDMHDPRIWRVTHSMTSSVVTFLDNGANASVAPYLLDECQLARSLS
jgi:hypothetical protein